MANQFIRREVSRLLDDRTRKDSLESYNRIIDVAIKIIWDLKNTHFEDSIDVDANMLFHMTVLKS